MEANAIREALRAIPFRPFRLHLADGRVMTVPHPEWFAIAPNGRQAVLFHPEGSTAILEPLLIVSLELDPPEGQGDGKKNGPVGGVGTESPG